MLSTARRLRFALAGSRRRRRGALLVVAQLAAVLAIVIGTGQPAAAGPQPVMEGYIPLPANGLVGSFEAIRSGAGTTLDFTVGVTSAGAGAIVTYDHWEDGYETDLANPSQTSTLVFGDGDTGNGDASSFCAACGGDLLPQGAPLIMRNNVPTPRPTTGASILFDGGDKVASTRGITITAGGFTTTRGSLQAAVVSSFDTSKFARSYTVPVGTDTPVPSGASNPFAYTASFVQASEDGTVVQIDRDADGTVDVTDTIDAGETLLTTSLREGATVAASAPVQVHLMTGDTSATYEARSFPLFPDNVLSNDYLSPAGTSVANFATVNFLYNPNDAAITVTPTCTGCSGTITVPAHASARFTSPAGRAVRFASGGEPFLAIAGVGAHSGSESGTASDNSSSWDWGFTMIPTTQLTTQIVLGWAPGNSNNPPSSPSGNRDDDPVWVTTTTATTLRVDLDGNPATGAITTPDCFGSHDLEIAVAALASTRIHDAIDGDMTGARIYTCDETLIAAAWGEDPANAPTGSPGFDAGYTVIPTTTMIVDKSTVLAVDTDGDGTFSPGDRVTYEISIADAGTLAFTDVVLDDVLQPGMTYVPGSTSYDDGSGDPPAPYADDSVPPATTAFPFDEDGGSLPSIDAGQTVVVRFDVTVDQPYLLSDGSLANTACVTAQEAEACDSTDVDLTFADLSLTKDLVGSPQRVGDEATFRITVANDGPDDVAEIEVTDVLPDGVTYVSSDPSQGSYDDATGIWTVGGIDVDGSATLDIVVTIDQESVTNYAEITGATAVDPDSQPGENPLDDENPPDQDDEDSVTVTVDPAAIDLSVTKDLISSGTHIGDAATFQVAVANDGPSVAHGVEVTDQLPAGLTYVSDAPTQGSYDAGTGVWTVGTLAIGGMATIDLFVTVDTDEAVTNEAQVTAADEDDVDSTPANDDPTEDDQDDAQVELAPLIDLEVAKSVVTAPTHLGDDATFEVSVTNRGPSAATGVVVTDQLGDDLTFVSSNAPGAYQGASGEWTVGDLAVDETATIRITATVGALNALNLAQVTAANEDDVDSTPDENPLSAIVGPDEDDEDGAWVTVAPLADLSLTKEQTGSPTHVGDETTFEVTVHNDGPSPATGIEVTDQLPAGLTYVSHDAPVGTYVPGTGVWTVGDLAVDASATLEITVTVDTDQPVTNRAQVSAVNEDDPDSEPGENPLDDQNPPDQDDEDEALVQVDPLVDVHLTKDLTEAPTHVGDTALFTIVVTNDGPSTATGVEVTDQLPIGLVLSGFTADQGSYALGSGVWTVGTLAPGASATMTLEVDVVEPGEITNVAEVTATDQQDVDSTPDNDDPTEDDQDDASVDTAPLIDLSLTKELALAPVHVGDLATYRITVSNAGPSPATGVVVTDLLPDGVTFVSSTAGLDYDPGSGAWTVGSLGPAQSTSMDVDVIVDARSVLNVAEVTAANEDDVDSQPGENPLDDQNPPDQDDEDAVPLTVAPLADLSLTKEQTGSPTHVGDETTFEVTVHNDGPSPATGIEVTDQLPAGLTYVSHTADQGTYVPGTGVWTVGDLAVDGSATLEITVTVDTDQPVTNRAQVTAVNEDDPDSEPGENPLDDQNPPDQDDEDEAGVDVDPLVDLHLAKSVIEAGTYVGDTATFAIVVTNDGPSPATGVAVDEALPVGLTYVAHSAGQGTYVPGTGIWTVGDLPVDGSATLELTVRVDTDEPVTNVAQVSDADQDDADSTPGNDDPGEDDQDDAGLDVDPRIDLSLTKVVSAEPTYLGDRATFRLTVGNDGPSTATEVEVTDVLPDGLRFVEATGGTYDPDTGIWEVGTLSPQASATLEITVVVESLAATNVAEVTDAAEDDVDSEPAENPLDDDQNPPDQDDEDLAAIEVDPLADLSLTKTSSPQTVDQLDEATFTIAVRNDGPSPATGIEVTDQLPDGVTYLSQDASQGSYDADTGIWTVGGLAVNGFATLDITIRVDDAGPITNTAEITLADQDDPDSTPDNDDPAEDDQDSTVLTSDPVIDLAVTKEVSTDRVDVGDQVAYTVRVANDGPSDATGVVVADALPDGVAYVSDDPEVGSYDPASGRWTVGDLAVDAGASLTIIVEVTSPGVSTNVAQVVEADQPDVDSQPDENPLGPDDPPDQDDEATVDLTGILIDLDLDIAADATVVGVGETVTFTVTVGNDGPSDATGVAVIPELPAGVTYVSSNPEVGSYDPATGTWTIGDLAVDETVVLEIVVVVDEAGEHTTVAQVTDADQPDVDSTPANDLPDEDDQDQVSIIGELADLSLTKAVSDDAPALGSQVTYTLTLANAGPSDATGVAVIDRLPDSLTYVSHQGLGTYDPTTGRWEVGDLAADAQAILLITVQVDGLGTTTNQAWVGESDQPDPDSTPDPDDPGPEGEDDHDQVDVTPVPATLRGVIWLDEDGDGTFDDDESPIPGVTIDLLDVDGELVATTTTDTEGGYVFTDLLPGTYTVVVDQSTLPATIDGQTYDPDDVSDSRFTVTVEAGQNVVDVDFGYEPVQAPEPPPTPEPVPEPPAPADRALPVTGSDALRLAGIGLALLAAGALVLFGRRRGTWAGLRR